MAHPVSQDRAAHEPSQSSLSRPIGEHPLRVLSLFSGIGGFDLGLERTKGFETVAFCEINPFGRRVMACRFPAATAFDDVRSLKGSDVGPIDVICGGFPCQDISSAASNRAVGLAGARSGLWGEFARLIGEIGPRYVIVENSPNLLAGGRGAWFGRVLSDLASLGYDAEWHCIPAAAVGANHIRDRVWIVAYPASERPRQLRWGERAAQSAAERNICWQEPEPSVERVADDVPDRVDRLTALGNAVVPQIPELIGRAILEAERAA